MTRINLSAYLIPEINSKTRIKKLLYAALFFNDTSPINNLAAINHLHLLHQLYETVFITEAVYRELTNPNFSVAGATQVHTFDWIQIRTFSNRITTSPPG
jgi:hypothetical protein